MTKTALMAEISRILRYLKNRLSYGQILIYVIK